MKAKYADYQKYICKWMAEQGLEGIVRSKTLFRVTNNRKLWRNMIAEIVTPSKLIIPLCQQTVKDCEPRIGAHIYG